MSLISDSHLNLMYRVWRAVKSDAVVIFIHGLGAHGERWSDFGDFLASRGISSFALELKGFGDTEGSRGDIESFSIYQHDIEKLCHIIENQYKDVPVFICGESLGGVISLAASLKKNNFAGTIAVAPAFRGKIKFSFWQYIGVGISLLLCPRQLFKVPFNSKMCTQDTDYLEQMEADKREHRTASARFLFNFLMLQKKTAEGLSHLNIPALFLLPEVDTVIDSDFTKKIYQTIKQDDKKLIEYKDMYHALTIDINRKVVFEDVYNWMKEKQVCLATDRVVGQGSSSKEE